MPIVNILNQEEQDNLKLQIKAYKVRCKVSYAQLAKYCFVSESTFRNWMARKPIPKAKAVLLLKLINDGKEQETPERPRAISSVTTLSFTVTPEIMHRLKQAEKPAGIDIITFIHSV